MNNLWSMDFRRGRVDYFVMSLLNIIVMAVAIGFGIFLLSLEPSGTSVTGPALILIGTVVPMVAAGFLTAQRIRDIGWPVTWAMVTFYGLGFFSGIFVELEQISLLLVLLQFLMSLVILFTPGRKGYGSATFYHPV